jgi:hypothetical protein
MRLSGSGLCGPLRGGITLRARPHGANIPRDGHLSANRQLPSLIGADCVALTRAFCEAALRHCALPASARILPPQPSRRSRPLRPVPRHVGALPPGVSLCLLASRRQSAPAFSVHRAPKPTSVCVAMAMVARADGCTRPALRDRVCVADLRSALQGLVLAALRPQSHRFRASSGSTLSVRTQARPTARCSASSDPHSEP